MRISVYGLGYVGCTSAACLAKLGHEIVGVDVKQRKVDTFNEGSPTFRDEPLARMMADEEVRGRLSATTDEVQAAAGTELSLICVGTPSDEFGGINLQYVKSASESVGRGLRDTVRHTVVVRSTVPPGTTEGTLVPILERASGKRAGNDFTVLYNPEFMREGSLVEDFFEPGWTIVGEMVPGSAAQLLRVYEGVESPKHITDVPTAEMIKYANNSFHALKVTFANEIGALCNQLGVDSSRLMRLFCQDDKLNLSPYYLTPGFAFGGSCLPKELRALQAFAKRTGLRCPLIESILISNDEHVKRAITAVMEEQKQNIGVLGLAFKAGTDDTRESPIVPLVGGLMERGYQRMFEKGFRVRIFDPLVNEQTIQEILPHLEPLLRESMDDVVKRSEVLVICNRSPEFRDLPRSVSSDHVVIDLVKMFTEDDFNCRYRVIS
jgi:GDP-mannose 6-dehydrogenase